MSFSLVASAVLLGVGLAMDAFAVSVCKGLAAGKVRFSHMAKAGAWFGGFQAIMPLIGYFLGSSFHSYIEKADHWVAFLLLVFIGINMLREAFSKEDAEHDANSSFGFKTMFIMAIATSIDALAVGITFAFLQVKIGSAITLIGLTTFVLSAIGVIIGNNFGKKYQE